MHTLHYIAVEADSKQEAFEIVQHQMLDDQHFASDWSDWHVVGGGRWNPEGDGYTDNDSQIVSYAENPELFKETLSKVRKWRADEMHRLMTDIKTDKFVSDMVDYISENGDSPTTDRFDMNRYYVGKAADLLQGKYTSDSYYFDLGKLDTFSSFFGYLEERLDSDTANNQYLVPVDFHF
jgi:hypothetical protein